MKPTKKANSQLASKRPFHTKGVMIRPSATVQNLPKLRSDFKCTQLPTHFQHDLNLVLLLKLLQLSHSQQITFCLVYMAQQTKYSSQS